MERTRNRATTRSWFVVEPSDFANEINLRAFASKDDAVKYAENEGGRVVDFDGVVDKFERASKAEGETEEVNQSQYEDDALYAVESLYIWSFEDEDEDELEQAAKREMER